MRRIARELNLSETVFVYPAEQPRHTRRLRIFTPSAELPFAGHPTIGTAHILASIGEIPLDREVTNIVFEEGVGPVPVRIRARNGRPIFAQLEAPRLPEFGPPPPPAETIAGTLSLHPSDLLLADAGPQAVSCGVPFLFVPVRDTEVMRRIRVNREQWERSFASYWAPHLYVFAYDARVNSSTLRARMFAPALGIEEDPATGAAATALAGYLGVRDGRSDVTLGWRIEQGFEMDRPSILDVEVDKRDGAIASIRVGGASVLVSEGTMEIPELAPQEA
jgi:trans-2,3-dihydro-3-hydroxyanthranilate isomerase